ncbi:hypothetical protein LSG31_10825 [Fodinisporobacter ferrooxydans]|uniref:Uncharacterized protein n=1 Tax=Fodinisporobacter ferrooxydans TaxID=2901836 RepID=A0ABY4CTL8_9BACL|nr:hypothetical protein LSG31_10825 [Alicyclobacillaceae bacterium MYW30-H2]
MATVIVGGVVLVILLIVLITINIRAAQKNYVPQHAKTKKDETQPVLQDASVLAAENPMQQQGEPAPHRNVPSVSGNLSEPNVPEKNSRRGSLPETSDLQYRAALRNFADKGEQSKNEEAPKRGQSDLAYRNALRNMQRKNSE